MNRFSSLSLLEKIMVCLFLFGILFSCVAMLLISRYDEDQVLSIDEYIAQVEHEHNEAIVETNKLEPLPSEGTASDSHIVDHEDKNYYEQKEQMEVNITEQKININTATLAQLQQLKGIGPSKAKAIIEEREKGGPFKSIEDIKRVKGIGDKTFQSIKESLVN